MKLSVIIPVYNVEGYLKCCVESLQPARYTEQMEIILVDDGSKDNSGVLCDEMAACYKNVRAFHQKNGGPGAARNRGLIEAVGEWICFVDSDDWVEKNFFDILCPYMLEAEYDVIFYGHRLIKYGKKVDKSKNDGKEIVIDRASMQKLEAAAIDKYSSKDLYAVTLWGKVYRNSLLKQNHIQFDAELTRSEDIIFNLQVYTRARAGICINRILYNYRIGQASICRNFNPHIKEDFVKSMEHMLPYITDERLKQAYYCRTIISCADCCFVNYCHADNKQSYSVRKGEFKKVLSEPLFEEAFKEYDLNKLPFRQRIFARACKRKKFWLVTILYKLNNMMAYFLKEWKI